MLFYVYLAAELVIAALLILCLEVIACMKNDCLEKEAARFGTTACVFKIGVIILLAVGILLSGWNAQKKAEQEQSSYIFPLVVRGDMEYLNDMQFSQTKDSRFFEAIGYSESQNLLVSISRGDMGVQFYQNIPASWYQEMLRYDGETLDTFLTGWANGTLSNWP